MFLKISLYERSVPTKCKRHNVAPVFRKGDREVTLNYRPVSQTSMTYEKLEKVIRRQKEFLTSTSYLSGRQHRLEKILHDESVKFL